MLDVSTLSVSRRPLHTWGTPRLSCTTKLCRSISLKLLTEDSRVHGAQTLTVKRHDFQLRLHLRDHHHDRDRKHAGPQGHAHALAPQPPRSDHDYGVSWSGSVCKQSTVLGAQVRGVYSGPRVGSPSSAVH